MISRFNATLFCVRWCCITLSAQISCITYRSIEYNIPEAAAVGGGVNNDDDDDDVEEVLGNNHVLKQWRLDIATAMWDDYVIYANEAGYVSEEEDEDIW